MYFYPITIIIIIIIIIIKVIKSRRIRWEGITATCERLKMHTLFWIRNLQVRGPLGRPRCE